MHSKIINLFNRNSKKIFNDEKSRKKFIKNFSNKN